MITRTNITGEIRNRIIEMRKSGMTITDIARNVHTSTPNVSKVLEDSGMPMKGHGRPKTVITDDIREMILSMYGDGKGIATIAKEIHSSATAVRNILDDEGVAIRIGGSRSRQVTPELEYEIVETHNAGMPIANMARKFHIAEEKISSILKENGIILHPGNKTKPITEELRQQIVSMRWKGRSIDRISRWVHLKNSTVKEILDEEGMTDVDEDEPKYTYMSYEDFEKMEFENKMKKK